MIWCLRRGGGGEEGVGNGNGRPPGGRLGAKVDKMTVVWELVVQCGLVSFAAVGLLQANYLGFLHVLVDAVETLLRAVVLCAGESKKGGGVPSRDGDGCAWEAGGGSIHGWCVGGVGRVMVVILAVGWL